MKWELKLKTMVRRMPWLKRLLKRALRIDTVNGQMAELERKLIYQYIRRLEERLRLLETKAGITGRTLLDFGDPNPPRFSKVVSQASTQEQMLEPEYAEWCRRLSDTPNFHRKHWEYCFILKALDQFDVLTPGNKGLGFGVGKDPIVAYMVTRGCTLVATDLDSVAAHEAGWSETNQYSEKLLDLNERRICTDQALKSQVSLRNVNMNSIPDDLSRGEFDFTWSACAFEHLGSIEQGLDFVENSLKCLKPGGIAVHTSELNVSSNDDTLTSGGTVLFRKRDFEALASRLRAKGHEIDLNFNLGNQNLDRYYDVPPYSEFTHLKLELDRFITTSYGLIIRKKA
jgi:hypothetical protein